VLANVCLTYRIPCVSPKSASCTAVFTCLPGKENAYSFERTLAYPTAARSVSSHSLAAHQRGEQMEMATLVRPPSTSCQFPESWQSVGNKPSDLASDTLRQCVERRAPHLKAFTSLDEHRIEKVHAR